jgi:hypothetical protein
MYANDHPLALNLDIGRIRALIGRSRDDPQNAALLARAIALAAARAHLAAGHDVVIPQIGAGRPAFLEQAEQVAAQAGASFHEIVLLDSKENAVRRFTERTRAGARSPRGGAGNARAERRPGGAVSHVRPAHVGYRRPPGGQSRSD